MAAVNSITEAEILDAIAATARGSGPKEARTLTEIAEASGMGDKRVRRALKQLKAQGRLVRHVVMRPRLDDTLFPCSAFTIKPKGR